MLVVCLNPTMDRQVFVDEVTLGSVSRATSNRRLAGGKAVDVCRAMAAHGVVAPLLVALPARHDDYLELLAGEGIPATLHEVPGDLRETIVLYEGSGRATVINGQGQQVTPEVWADITSELVTRAGLEDWVVLSGSFPPGVTGADVHDLVASLRRAGAKVAVDTGPAWLREALPARPDLITPNLAEAQQALTARFGVEAVEFGDEALEDARAAARQLADHGIGHVVVTVGSAGSAWATADADGTCAAMPVETVNPIGAGDAFLGGLLARLAAGSSLPDAVRAGTATAASAVLQWIPGRADADQTRAFLEQLG